jgi:membrane protein DedA with SNARE-associated domain
MSGLDTFVGQWGYLAIIPAVVLGNAGVPIPEEAVLAVAGYLVWTGQLRLFPVLVVGILSAVAGDTLGYWAGRRYGPLVAERYRDRCGVPARGLERVRCLVARYGPLAVFAARFVPGLRAMAGPLAGASGVRFVPFVVANVQGAAIYVPLSVTFGYGIAGLLGPLRRVVGDLALLILVGGLIGLAVWAAWRTLRPLGLRSEPT